MASPARDTGWFKSSRSSGNGAACVEVRHTSTGVGLRDSKNAEGPALAVPASSWAGLLAFTSR
ncbi:DUF397 domain-containing protein [Alloactinosynnema sp. L-07]|uniref:DUF397 domain-containing protein n=1 Tax=Alloactinosynnema sp. L-07 TaxID=1653480 RepID=UPI0009EDBB4F|nr:DUF397 domain-containing protein [Alloactinosynnema sp. L-07]